jgi:arabinofuranan 3-O-arabinosyltransferase
VPVDVPGAAHRHPDDLEGLLAEIVRAGPLSRDDEGDFYARAHQSALALAVCSIASRVIDPDHPHWWQLSTSAPAFAAVLSNSYPCPVRSVVQRLLANPGVDQIVWPIAAILFAVQIRNATSGTFGVDLHAMWQGSRHFLHHEDPYGNPHTYLALLYPPASLVAFAPLALLPFSVAKYAMVVVCAAVLVWSIWIVARTVRPEHATTITGIGVLGLALFGPSYSTFLLLNISLLFVPAVAAFLWFAARQRWVAAAVILGISLSIKPVLVPLILVAVMARRWRAVAFAIAIPVLANLAVLPLLSKPGQFLDKTAPAVLRGDVSTLGANNLSLAGISDSFNIPAAGEGALRITVACFALIVLWRLGGRAGDFGDLIRIAEAAALVLAAGLIVAPVDEVHYHLALVPVLVTAASERSVLRGALVWLGVALIGLSGLPNLGFSQTEANQIRSAVGLGLIVAGVTIGWAVRARNISTPESGTAITAQSTAGTVPGRRV